MAIAGSTWRKHPFEVGQWYVALQTVDDARGKFIAGTRYALRHIGYSHYDSSTVFTFQAQYVDCLLYTSPSPRDKRQSRMPSSA